LAFKSWGGRREGAGRKPEKEKAGVSHAPRAPLAARFPVHVTARLRAGLPNLRRSAARRAIEAAFCAAKQRSEMRLVQYSIQTNHLHLIVEAADRSALSRGMQGLLVRLARALNRLWKRMGTVFSDRYHEHILRTPKEVKSALVYVLNNARKHGIRLPGVDPYSSGEWFEGWESAALRAAEPECGPVPVESARTWLLRVGWRRYGLVA
jgi:REP-associated tyrosine transposase